MKSLRRLLPVAVLAVSLAASLPVRADDTAARKAAADELLKVMHTQEMLDRAATRISQSADRMMPPFPSSATPVEETAFREGLRQQAAAVLKEQLNWASFEPILVDSYATNFTEPELKQLTDFYKSPVGQKFLEKQPELISTLNKVSQQKISGAVKLVQKALQPSIQKFRTDHPASPAGSLSGPMSTPPPAAVAVASPVPSATSAPVTTPTVSPAPTPSK